MKNLSLIIFSLFLAHCQKAETPFGTASSSSNGALVKGAGAISWEDPEQEKIKTSGALKNKKKSVSQKSIECDLDFDLNLDEGWQGVSLPLEIDDEKGDLCEALRSLEKHAAIIYLMDEDCASCAQEIRNIDLAIQRSEYRSNLGLVVVSVDESDAEVVEEYAPDALFAIDTSESFIESLPEEILESRGKEDKFPFLALINSELDYEFLYKEEYLSAVEKTADLLKNVEPSADADPIVPKTLWDGKNHKGTGLVDLIPIH